MRRVPGRRGRRRGGWGPVATVVNVHEAKTHLSRLIDRAAVELIWA